MSGAAGSGNALHWGKALWDGEKAIATFTDNSIESCNRVRAFMSSYAQIQINFGKEIRKLCRQYVDGHKKEEFDGTCVKAWLAMLQETDDIGKQHESVGETLMAAPVEAIKNLAKDYKVERQRRFNELGTYQAELDKARKKHEAAKKQYEKCAKDANDASLRFEKADKDDNVVKSKIDKLRLERDKLGHEADSAKRELLVTTDQLNQAQQVHYHGHVVEIFDALETLECNRIANVSQHMATFSKTTRQVLPIIGTCLTNIDQAVAEINGACDTAQFLDAKMTGLQPPDINGTQDVMSPATGLSVHKINERRVMKTKLFHTTTRKKDAVREDFGHLPPEQRRKALLKRVNELEDEEKKDQKTIDALAKTMDMYTSNPGMGDAKSVEKCRKELQALQEKLDTKTKPQIYKFKLYLSALEGGPPPERPEGQMDDDDFDEFEDGGDEEDFDARLPHPDMPPPPPPGTAAAVLPQAKVVFAFEGGKESELPVKEGDVVEVVENDGSGWLRARLNGRDGYVPLSYVQML